MRNPRLKISVVVCTYNRARLLRSVLESLSRQELSPEDYEIIIVDNRSTDETRSVVDEFLICGNVRYVFEDKQGLAHARNAGWQAAEGTFVGYLDDDSLAPSEWLAVAAAIVEEGRFEFFGGPIRPCYPVSRPAWYKEDYDLRTFGVKDEPLVFKHRGYLSGGNLFVSKRLLATVGGFRADFGMVGKSLAYGEETDLLMRLREVMPDLQVLCDPKLYNFHLVRPEKYSLWWNVKDNFARGRNSPRLFNDSLQEKKRRTLLLLLVRDAYDFIKDVIGSLFSRDRQAYPYWQNYFKEQALSRIHKLGRICFYLNDK